MKVITSENAFFKFTPRFISNDSIFVLDNNQIVNYTIENDLVTILDTSIFSEGDTYCFTILSNNEIVYKGKIIFLKNDTDVQNYNANTQSGKRWQ